MTHTFRDLRVWDRSKPPERFKTRAEMEPDRTKPVVAAGIWQPWDTVPMDGTTLLICVPSGSADHFYVMHWDEYENAWISDSNEDDVRADEDFRRVHLGTMWAHLYFPPNSLCYGIGDGMV